MRKYIFLLLFMTVTMAQAQTVKFGYLSYDAALKSMPAYAAAQKDLETFRQQCQAELQRSEMEFSQKYEDFLEGQRDFAPSILRKRQAELVEMMQKNTAFKEEVARLEKQAEQDAIAPLKDRLQRALSRIGQERGYAFILNTDANAVPYINTEFGENLNEIVINYLK